MSWNKDNHTCEIINYAEVFIETHNRTDDKGKKFSASNIKENKEMSHINMATWNLKYIAVIVTNQNF